MHLTLFKLSFALVDGVVSALVHMDRKICVTGEHGGTFSVPFYRADSEIHYFCKKVSHRLRNSKIKSISVVVYTVISVGDH